MKRRALLMCMGFFALACQRAEAPASTMPVVEESPGGPVFALAGGLVRMLEEPSMRQWLDEGIAGSPYIEQRIALRRVLDTAEAGLIDDLLGQARLDGGWQSVREQIPELELYFPIPTHYARWKNGEAANIAVPSDDRTGYTIFHADGTRLEVSAEFIPPDPTLVLGASEIDYGDLESALIGGVRTGGYLQRQARAGASGGAGISSVPAACGTSAGGTNCQATYLTYWYLYDDHDPGLSGYGEMEVFTGTLGGFAWSKCTRYTGMQAEVEYLGNTSSPFYRINLAVPVGTYQMLVDAWEDDNGGCGGVAPPWNHSGDDHFGRVNLTYSQYGTIWGTQRWVDEIGGETEVGDINLKVTAGS